MQLLITLSMHPLITMVTLCDYYAGETEILAEQQPPQGVCVCDHAGLVINNFSGAACAPQKPPKPVRRCQIPNKMSDKFLDGI